MSEPSSERLLKAFVEAASQATLVEQLDGIKERDPRFWRAAKKRAVVVYFDTPQEAALFADRYLWWQPYADGGCQWQYADAKAQGATP